MYIINMPSFYNDQNRTVPPEMYKNDRSPLRNPPLGSMEQMWIALIVIIPLIIVILLCTIITCIYRHRKKGAQQNAINSLMTPMDQHNAAVATIVHNSRQGPIIMEELPPSYEFITTMKKDLQYSTRNINTNEQVDLSSIKNETTITVPSASPSNSDNIGSSNKA